MSKRIIWVTITVLMVLSLAACGPAATPSSPSPPAAPTTPASPTTPVTPTAPTTPAQEKPQREAVQASAETPEYGGVIKLVLTGDITTFDEAPGPGIHAGATTLHLTNGTLVKGDWTKGPAGGYGTGKTGWDWAGPIPAILGLETGSLAESWEMLGPGRWTFHIRKGARYAIAANEAARLVSGREFDANDAAFALKRYLTSQGSYIYRSYPGLRAQASVTVRDKLTLEIKVPPEMAIDAVAMFFDFATVDTPPEVIARYGSMTDWKNSVGTGPFILTEYVGGSVARLVRNANYWMKDPLGPGKGNQLPYLDGVSYFVIPDASTRMAALRTGKVDMMSGVGRDDGADMIKRVPQLLQVRYAGASTYTAMRTDKPPFNDIRVRRALMMATDYKAIVNSLFGGSAPIVTWPLKPNKEFVDAYYGPDPTTGVWPPDAPESVKELYTYNPEKAKQLLKEAGYPNGLKTTVLLTSTGVDYMSVIKDMWAKAGIDLTLEIKESVAFSSIAAARTYDNLIYGFSAGAEGALYQAIRMRGGGVTNQSYVNDPVVHQAAETMQKVLLTDRAEANRTHKELMKYALDQVWMLPSPQDNPYTFWWPWLKHYSGEASVGYFAGQSWAQFVWLDQDLKKRMGY